MTLEVPVHRRGVSSVSRSCFGVAVVVLALSLAGCSPWEPMLSELDGIPLPDDLVLLHEERGGPDICFAGDCPWVDREYTSARGFEEVCRDMQAAIEDWGVTDAGWRVSESERNPCTASARRGRYWVSVSVLDFSRFERFSSGRAADAPPDSRGSAVRIGLRTG